MKSKDITTKQDGKDKICLSCFERIKTNPWRNIVENDCFLCDKCISDIKTKLSIEKCNGIFVLFLGNYDGIMKTWLMNYKEYGDIELAKCFLFLYLPILRFLFRNYIFVPCPSSEKRNQNRGFIHLEEMLKAYRLPYCLALDKTSDEENKERSVSQRNAVSSLIRANSKASLLSGKKIVVFDDVFTTGNTFRYSCQAIEKVHPKKIRGLILMKTKKPDCSL